MAYPTGMLSLTLEDADRRLSQLKTQCQSSIAKMAAGPVNSPEILGLFARLRSERAALAAAKDVPGIGAYAQEQKSNGTLDVAAEFNAVLARIDDATNWINTNFPKDLVNGWLLAATLGPNDVVQRTFSSAQTAGLRTALQSIVDAIN